MSDASAVSCPTCGESLREWDVLACACLRPRPGPEWEAHRANLRARDRAVSESAARRSDCHHDARCKCWEKAKAAAHAVLHGLVQDGWTLVPPGDKPMRPALIGDLDANSQSVIDGEPVEPEVCAVCLRDLIPCGCGDLRCPACDDKWECPDA